VRIGNANVEIPFNEVSRVDVAEEKRSAGFSALVEIRARDRVEACAADAFVLIARSLSQLQVMAVS